MARFYIVISIFLLIVSCSKVDSKIEEYSLLKTKVYEGDVSWVKTNSANITTIKESEWGGRKYYENEDFWEIQQYRSNFMQDMASTIADQASKESTVEAAYQVLYDFEKMTARHPKTNKKYINVPLYLKNWEEINLETQLSIFQSFGEKYDDVVFDLTDQSFIKDELCRAVGKDEILYVTILIGFADFDVGYLRCYDTGEYGFFQYAAANGRAGRCPMSLRRVSGINAGAKIASRNSTWLNNLKQSGAADTDDIKEIKKRFQSSFQNLPSLSGVGDMNSLLDRYNKWAFGGNCSTDLKEGYSLPSEFR